MFKVSNRHEFNELNQIRNTIIFFSCTFADSFCEINVNEFSAHISNRKPRCNFPYRIKTVSIVRTVLVMLVLYEDFQYNPKI